MHQNASRVWEMKAMNLCLEEMYRAKEISNHPDNQEPKAGDKSINEPIHTSLLMIFACKLALPQARTLADDDLLTCVVQAAQCLQMVVSLGISEPFPAGNGYTDESIDRAGARCSLQQTMDTITMTFDESEASRRLALLGAGHLLGQSFECHSTSQGFRQRISANLARSGMVTSMIGSAYTSFSSPPVPAFQYPKWDGYRNNPRGNL